MFINVHTSEDNEEYEKNEFYSLLDNTLSDILKGDMQMILGYFNIKIGLKHCF